MNYWTPDDFGTHERMIFIRQRRARGPIWIAIGLALLIALLALGSRFLEEGPPACRDPYVAPIGQIEYQWEIYCMGGR